MVVAHETIKKFGFEWDLIIPRKIGSPHNKEVAIGAVSLDGTCFLNERYINKLNIYQEYIEEEISEQINEIKRRLNKYKGNENFPDVKNRTVIIIDDGIATGFTIQAAIESVREHGAKKIVLAIPVAPDDIIDLLNNIVDEIICLFIPDEFYAVGAYYESFEQTIDEEIFNIMDK